MQVSAFGKDRPAVERSLQPPPLLARYEHFEHWVNERIRNRIIWTGYRRKLRTLVDFRSLPFYSDWSEWMHADALTYLRRYSLSPASVLWHRAFHAATGAHDRRYVSEPLFYSRIEPRLSQRTRISKYFDKNFYGRLGITSEPAVVARVVAGRLTAADLSSIDVKQLQVIIAAHHELVVKPALDSGGGNCVHFVKRDKLVPFLAQLKRQGIYDLVVQQPIEQCAELALLNPDSVNTLRILTMRLGKRIINLSSVLRIGRAGSRVDNLAAGGLSVGVTERGTLKAHAYDRHFVCYERHPNSGAVFSNYPIPAFRESIDLCAEKHAVIPDVDLISWDVAVTSENAPIVVELNMNLQAIGLHQLSNGPLFGDFTDVVFERYCR